MSDNSNIWEFSNFENVIEKLKSKKDLLQRTILTCTSATSLSTKSVDQSDLKILLEKSGKITIFFCPIIFICYDLWLELHTVHFMK